VLPDRFAMSTSTEQWVKVFNDKAKRRIVLVCEHASNVVPSNFNGLGLSRQQLQSHIAWDLSALSTAKLMAKKLDATLVASQVSRLLYDCNRPPESPSAIPLTSENQPIPGNVGLSMEARQQRVTDYYRPFEAAVAKQVSSMGTPLIITVHSFTPVFLGQQRQVEIGVLHDQDSRFADAFLQQVLTDAQFNIQRNQPYAPTDGVTHTLKHHALPGGLANVMLEIRNDLIESSTQQKQMAAYLTKHIVLALERI
jgi:predicted N-formylglutamate amidohydrolase